MTRKHRSLASAFSGAPSIDKIAQSDATTPNAAPTAPTEQQPATQPDPTPTKPAAPKPAATKPAAPTRSTQRGRPPKGSTQEKATTAFQVSLPEDLDTKARHWIETNKSTWALLLFTAIESTVDQLPALLAGDNTTDRPKLFSLPSAPTTTDGPRILHTLRVTKTNFDTLNKLVDDCNAPSRNTLITTAIKKFLTN